MSGHSKWATTKHRKAAQDAKRSALFSKLSRNITVAAKEGGDPNPDNNASLAAAIEKAKGYSLPKDKIKTAIDKAFGSGKDAANYETVVYEGYGPAGVAVYCEALTDNRNRTAADVRSAFSHAGGSLGTSGSVAFQFERKGQIVVPKQVETGDKKNPIGPNGAAADEEEFVFSSICTTAERIFCFPTHSEIKSRAVWKYNFCSSGGKLFINSGEAVMSVSTIITLSRRTLQPASAIMRLISFL